ncbi:MAG: hypothetical protein IKO06_04485 [Alphaproteobacteria bacterium]|nr:hypothetical protein [Alphaproteobacteria bacterium]
MLSSLSVLSLGGGVFGITTSLFSVALILALWVLALIILHPVHALIFVLSGALEYLVIEFFFFDVWVNLLIFFAIYFILFAIYGLYVRRLLPLPKSKVENLFKLAELHDAGKIDDEEYKKAKKLLLKN